MQVLANFGRGAMAWLELFGDFWRFTAQTYLVILTSRIRLRFVRLLTAQMYEIGTRSLPVVMVTGMFVGMVLAVQAVVQFKNAGLEGPLGAVVNLSVLRELGPVLTAVLLAGRVGGSITAELGTMRVTEQIEALRAMGSNPIRHLVAPRLLACLILGPFLVVYANLMGIVGGYYVSVGIYGVNQSLYLSHAAASIEMFDISMGLIKSFLFSGAIAQICCHKAFRCKPGAAGVGRACTEAFVASCMSILMLDFFLNVVLTSIYQAMYGVKGLIG
ncbi:MAG: ABC transporter permease [Planctomycetes bacterium]|nr:ABC transporter permease [Planctomycetota bacterium]